MEAKLNVHVNRHGYSVLRCGFELPLLHLVNGSLIEIVARRALDPYCVDRTLFSDTDPQNRDGFMRDFAGRGIQRLRVENNLWRDDAFADFEVLFWTACLRGLVGSPVALPYPNAG